MVRAFISSLLQLTAVVALLTSAGLSSADDEMSLYDWMGTAPVIVAAENLDTYGKFSEFRIDQSLRGDLPVGQTIRVGIRWANRDRNRELNKDPLRFEAGTSYLLLLAPASMKDDDHAKPAFGLIRSVNGARVIPAEGAAPLLEAVTEFVELQYANNDDITWDRLSQMLESTNPFMLETALDQHVKFRRGTTRDLASLRPLIAHPAPETRRRALSISAIIIQRSADEPLPDADLIRIEFSGRARRDDDPRVRSAAVDALAQLDLPGIDLLLEEIARDDPDQGVRYSAERRLLEREERRPASAEKGGAAH